MNGLTMDDLIKEKAQEAIEDVLEGNSKSQTLKYVYINDVDAIVKDLGGVKLDDRFDSNGWQWDFWQYYKIGHHIYILSGSGYYGGYTFGLNEDDEQEHEDE